MKIILTGIISFLAITLTQGQASKSILVQNKLSIERKDELIVFTKSLLQQKLGKIADGKYIIAIHKNTPQLLQFDDLDKDGAWDEAVLLHSFKPYEIAVFTVKISDHPATIKAVVQAHVRQRHKLEDESFGPSVLKDTMPYNNPPTDFSKQKLKNLKKRNHPRMPILTLMLLT